jgi:hypothetical protein
MVGEGMINFGIGVFLDLASQGQLSSSGAPIYSIAQYEHVLSWVIFPVLALCIGAAGLSLREKKHIEKIAA